MAWVEGGKNNDSVSVHYFWTLTRDSVFPPPLALPCLLFKLMCILHPYTSLFKCIFCLHIDTRTCLRTKRIFIGFCACMWLLRFLHYIVHIFVYVVYVYACIYPDCSPMYKFYFHLNEFVYTFYLSIYLSIQVYRHIKNILSVHTYTYM